MKQALLVCAVLLGVAAPALAANDVKPPPKPAKCAKGDIAIRDKDTGKLSCYQARAPVMIGTPQPIPAKPKSTP